MEQLPHSRFPGLSLSVANDLVKTPDDFVTGGRASTKRCRHLVFVHPVCQQTHDRGADLPPTTGTIPFVKAAPEICAPQPRSLGPSPPNRPRTPLQTEYPKSKREIPPAPTVEADATSQSMCLCLLSLNPREARSGIDTPPHGGLGDALDCQTVSGHAQGGSVLLSEVIGLLVAALQNLGQPGVDLALLPEE